MHSLSLRRRFGSPSSRALGVLFAVAIAAQGALWWFASRFPSGEAPLVLHFRSGGGIDLLGGRTMLWTIPAVGAVILAVNAFLAALLRSRDATLALLAAVVAAVAQIFLALALMALFAVNVS